MRFNPEEYLLLSRRGSVPLSSRSGARQHQVAGEPVASERLCRQRRVRRFLAARRQVARSVRGGLRATWTAFGPGGPDL